MNRKWNWAGAFPQSCTDDVRVVTRLLPHRLFKAVAWGTIDVTFFGERLILPSRLYLNEVKEEKIQTLTNRQRWILYCMYTRHHDGYIREKYVQRLKQEQAKMDWVLLYLIELTGEYIYEILERIEQVLHIWSEAEMKTFVQANNRYLERIERRIISYWDVYHRTIYPVLWDPAYVGFRIARFYRTYRALS